MKRVPLRPPALPTAGENGVHTRLGESPPVYPVVCMPAPLLAPAPRGACPQRERLTHPVTHAGGWCILEQTAATRLVTPLGDAPSPPAPMSSGDTSNARVREVVAGATTYL